MAAGDDAPPVELAAMTGMKYLFFEQRAPAGAEENEVTFVFQGARTGMAAWLADSGSGGAAEYLSADALVAGYVSTREPWLPLTPDFATRNVATMREDDTSILRLTSKLLHYRRAHPALGIGSQRLLHASDHVLAYERLHGADQILVALNFCHDTRSFSPPNGLSGAIALSTHGGRSGERVHAKLELRGNEGVVIKIG